MALIVNTNVSVRIVPTVIQSPANVYVNLDGLD